MGKERFSCTNGLRSFRVTGGANTLWERVCDGCDDVVGVFERILGGVVADNIL